MNRSSRFPSNQNRRPAQKTLFAASRDRLARIYLIMDAYPEWLHVLACVYLGLSLACAALIVVDELCPLLEMEIMNFLWPITTLYFGPLAQWGYQKSGE